MHVSKNIAIEMDVDQDVTNQTVVSYTDSTEHEINILDLAFPEESSE